MSQHTIIQGPTKVFQKPKEDRRLLVADEDEAPELSPPFVYMDIKWVFGWDQPLQSFYLQMHDGFRKDEDVNPILWLGATADTKMYEIEDLVKAAKQHGLDISHELQVELYGEKDDGV